MWWSRQPWPRHGGLWGARGDPPARPPRVPVPVACYSYVDPMIMAPVVRLDADARAVQLLHRYLTPKQQEQVAQKGWFEVTGSDGKRYGLLPQREVNVYCFDDGCYYCAAPADSHRMPLADQVLLQMLLITTNAPLFRVVAVPYRDPRAPMPRLPSPLMPV